MSFLPARAIVQPSDSPKNFAEALVRLATADPELMTGWVALHDEILHPGRGTRLLTNA